VAISLKVQNTLICVFCPKSLETVPNVAPPFLFKKLVQHFKRKETFCFGRIEKYRNRKLGEA
jgi:hypothetical protein